MPTINGITYTDYRYYEAPSPSGGKFWAIAKMKRIGSSPNDGYVTWWGKQGNTGSRKEKWGGSYSTNRNYNLKLYEKAAKGYKMISSSIISERSFPGTTHTFSERPGKPLTPPPPTDIRTGKIAKIDL